MLRLGKPHTGSCWHSIRFWAFKDYKIMVFYQKPDRTRYLANSIVKGLQLFDFSIFKMVDILNLQILNLESFFAILDL